MLLWSSAAAPCRLYRLCDLEDSGGFMRKLAIVVVSFAALWFALPATAAPKTKTVVLIVSDGLRWQEVFTGADPLLLDSKNGGSWMEEGELQRKFWRGAVGAR